MELAQICQVRIPEVRPEKIDFFIAASGYQDRSVYLASLNPAPKSAKYMFSFAETDHLDKRKKNEEVFTSLGFKTIQAYSEKSAEIEALISRICQDYQSDEIILLVDYSCMPRLWFAAILDSISRNDFKARKITVFFSYTPKKFSLENQRRTFKYLGPMIFSRDELKKKRPVALVVGLDNSIKPTMEIIRKLNPAVIMAFVPENSIDSDYTESVLEKNKPLLSLLDKNNIIHYDALQPEGINTRLTSKCLDLRIEHEVVIVPQGPKSFSLISSLLSIRYPDIKLWEIITAGKAPDPQHGAAEGEPVVLKVTFFSDEEEED